MSHDDFSPTQKRVLIMLHVTHPIPRQLSGDRMIAVCSGARALVRKGLIRSLGGSQYYLMPHAVDLALKVRNEARAELGKRLIKAPGQRGEG